MYYKIQKSLGNISAVLTDNIPHNGVCVEFKNFNQKDASIIIFRNGYSVDLHINGWTFPCVYNNIGYSHHSDIYGGEARHVISFDFLFPDGSVGNIEERSVYGEKESLAVEYFYSMLYNLSCCESIEQFRQLSKYIINNNWFKINNNRAEAIEVIDFIEKFTPRLSQVKDTDFLPGLKHKIQVKFKEAQEIISSAACPELG